MVIEPPASARAPVSLPSDDEGDVVIAAHNLGKMYRIYDKPQDRLKQMLLWRLGRHYGREFWALRDVSFEVRRGDSVGIIGRNGSGKSTLLQIIAGTLSPSEGEVTVRGRVAALLELGSGFNPEFTGRENVFMNGAILGLSREEIEARYDDIAAFADIGEFIEQPVKLYSSGMVVRLAFAVQAHVQPDLLIVDEALSVGDVFFQHKCMHHIRGLIDRGTTLLFVSHSTDSVKRLCSHGLWLDGGRARHYGAAGVAAEKYLAFMRMQDRVVDLAPVGPLDDAASVLIDDLDGALPLFAGEIDLSLRELFLRGDWVEQAVPQSALPARLTHDREALAAFRFVGSELELAFVGGPEAGTVRVVIDGRPRVVELGRGPVALLESAVFSVPPGEHHVYISREPGLRNGPLCWLGGRARAAAPELPFRSDHSLDQRRSEVGRYGSGKARLTAVELLDYRSGEPLSEVQYGQWVRLRLHAERLQAAGPRLEFSFIVRDQNRLDLFGTTTVDQQLRLDPDAARFSVEFAFPVRLGPGSYSVLAAFVECAEDLSARVPMDQIDIAVVFTVPFNPSQPVWYMVGESIAIRGSCSASE